MPEIVLVTQKEFSKGEKVFRSAPDLNFQAAPAEEQALAQAALAAKCRAVVLGVERYVGPLYAALGKTGGPRGAIIARFGVGHDGVDKALARQHNAAVTNTPGALDISVAEHTIWLMGCLARNVSAMEARFRAGEFPSQTGAELGGKTLGIVGLGAIGRRVAAMARFGLGMKVFASGRRPESELGKELSALGVDRYTNDPDAVFREADVVSIHLPSNAQTRHFVNAQRLALMKSSAFLVNTARGAVLDEAALYDALAAHKLAGAALDVYEKEPYLPASGEVSLRGPASLDKDLRSLKNVVLTPHIGSNTHEANERIARACVANVSHFFAGRMNELTRVG
jgi:lactate dehydrogenase-like 2-hydroxyacid dehydrogenase